jgi:acetylornithine deacetylase/succinyl-diaminopimelate desuccinylase-like protein
MNVDPVTLERVKSHVNRRRLIDTARALIEVPSPTGQAAAVSDRLAELLEADGFHVARPSGGYPAAPAVAVWLESGAPGPVLQFNGHLDTVHLPFIPPAIENGLLTGSGASDMKGGIAAAVEALRAIRDSGCLRVGSVLLTAHDLHEAPWGDGRQLNELIRQGIRGDAVLLPEPLCNVLPVAGRGSATWRVFIRRQGVSVHEVMRPRDEPGVIAAAAELIARIGRLESELATQTHAVCGAASVFIGQVHSGEIFNQFPHESWLEGTRRWLPGDNHHAVEADFRARLAQLAADTRTAVSCEWMMIRDAFALERSAGLVRAFQQCYRSITGSPLACGAKPFVDDGNSFWALAEIPAITHGPRAGGQHTTSEWVEIDDLVRVAELYAATALVFCHSSSSVPSPSPPVPLPLLGEEE